MTAHAYTEDRIVEQPAIALFAELGWQTVSAMEEAFGPGGTLGRETSGEVVLAPRLRAALQKLNPKLPPEAIASAVEELSRDRSAMTLAGANREVWALLKDGVKVQVPDRERGGLKDEPVRVVDWENPAANDFLLVSQMTITGQLYTCRPDLIAFVNGLPWVVIELKKPGVAARQAVAEATAYCKARGVDLAGIEGTSAEKFERAQALEDGANRLLAPEAVKRDFLSRARLVDALYGAVKPDPVAVEFATRCGSIRALADTIRNRTDPPDISHVMQGIQELLDGSIATEPFKIQERSGGYPAIDLSKIDFEALAKRFEKKKPKSADLERLKAAVRAQLERMARLNRTRADYLEKFQQLIDDYNAGSRNIEEIFRDLLALSGALTQEQERHVREHLSEEELTVFDILTRPGPNLTTEEREEVKKAAKQLLTRLNALLVLGWRQKIQARAQVKLAIEDALDEGLPRAYTKDLYQSKCAALFEHVYESYLGDWASAYRDAA